MKARKVRIRRHVRDGVPTGRWVVDIPPGFTLSGRRERPLVEDELSARQMKARIEGRIGGRRRKLDAKKRREIADSVISGRKSGAEMARLYDVSEPTVSRIVAEHRRAGEKAIKTGLTWWPFETMQVRSEY